MPSIVIKSAQANFLTEDAPGDADLIPIGEYDPETRRSTPHGAPPTPEEVSWADDDSGEGDDLTPSSPEAVKPLTEIPPPPGAEEAPVEPEKSFEEVEEEQSEIDKKNETLSVREKIWYALDHPGTPLRIVYTSLGSFTTERTVEPAYVYWAGTHRHVLVAWCELRNDWRAFIVDRITQAKLEGSDEQKPIA